MVNINRNLLALVLIIGTVLPVSITSTAFAQNGLSYRSSFQVQNLSSATANITINFYNQYKGMLLGAVTDSIGANSSKTYFPICSTPGQEWCRIFVVSSLAAPK